MICGRCGHPNPDGANYCSSCGAAIVPAEETTLTLSAVEAADVEEDLAKYLEELAPGVGLLVLRQGTVAGSSYRLEAPVTTAGRHPDSDIFLDDITVSRRHAIIERDADGFKVRDAGSLNGTYVNRERVDEARLRTGDELQIGRFRLSFVVGEAREP
ncbi:MAG TPA: FHA domain-containing protein [Acidimicrobiia bacterium]